MVDVSGVPKITSVIDNINALTAEQLEQGGRYEVVLDHVDGDHHELELHFRLVELTATGPLRDVDSGTYTVSDELAGPDSTVYRDRPGQVSVSLRGVQGLPSGSYEGVVERVHYRPGATIPTIEVALADVRGKPVEYHSLHHPGHYAGGLEGAGPVMPLIRKRGVNPVRLAKLLSGIISLSRISPHVLGIPDGEGPAYKRVLDYLSGDDAG